MFIIDQKLKRLSQMGKTREPIASFIKFALVKYSYLDLVDNMVPSFREVRNESRS